MDIAILKTIFTRELEGVEDGNTITLPHGTRVTVFLNTPGGVLPISKVHGVTIAEGYVSLGSDEGRLFTEIAAIAAVRADQEARNARDGRVGFS